MAQDRKRLLIVDDTKIDRMVLKGILGNDYEILEASSGNMAFEYLTTREEQLDAIFWICLCRTSMVLMFSNLCRKKG